MFKAMQCLDICKSQLFGILYFQHILSPHFSFNEFIKFLFHFLYFPFRIYIYKIFLNFFSTLSLQIFVPTIALFHYPRFTFTFSNYLTLSIIFLWHFTFFQHLHFIISFASFIFSRSLHLIFPNIALYSTCTFHF